MLYMFAVDYVSGIIKLSVVSRLASYY